LTIRVQELEPIYATDYQQNVIEERKRNPSNPKKSLGDLYSISKSEVGY
jgi:hypothetical protein